MHFAARGEKKEWDWKKNVLAFKEKVFSETVEGWNAKSSHVNPLCDLACVYSWMNFMLLWCMRCLSWHSSVDLISWTDSASLCLNKSAQPLNSWIFADGAHWVVASCRENRSWLRVGGKFFLGVSVIKSSLKAWVTLNDSRDGNTWEEVLMWF